MGRGDETKLAMVEGARYLVKLNGYNATSFADVNQYVKTPRGSTYFHFPEGKEQLGEAVVQSGEAAIVEIVERAGTQTRTPRTFVRRFATLLADRLENSNYTEGCPIAAVALEKSETSPRLRAAASSAFDGWATAVANQLQDKGLTARQADDLAMLVVSTTEGAILVGKARRSRRELDDAGELLAGAIPEPGRASRPKAA